MSVWVVFSVMRCLFAVGIRYVRRTKDEAKLLQRMQMWTAAGCRRMLRSRKQGAGVFKSPVTHHLLHELVSLDRLTFWFLYDNPTDQLFIVLPVWGTTNDNKFHLNKVISSAFECYM